MSAWPGGLVFSDWAMAWFVISVFIMVISFAPLSLAALVCLKPRAKKAIAREICACAQGAQGRMDAVPWPVQPWQLKRWRLMVKNMVIIIHARKSWNAKGNFLKNFKGL